MSTHRNVNKLVVVKKLTDLSLTIDQILRIDLESNNKGFIAVLADGRLIVTTWIKKKVSSKFIEEAADGCWQQGYDSEVVIARQNGSLVRYSLHFDTGLSCSLQLSAPSLLALIREKDSSIRSARNLKVWSHTSQFILLQPQSDRLVLLATNAGGRPTTHGVLRTLPLRSAHLFQSTILVQPITGTDLYEYDTGRCKLVEVVSLSMQRVGSEYIEWGSLACSSTGDTIALTDSERHLYLTNFKQRTPLKKRGGVNRSSVTLHQVIWPASLQPEDIVELTLGLSDTTLTVFCTISHDMQESQHYVSFDVGVSSLNCHHIFSESAAIIPGTTHHLPDLFFTTEGMAMLMDEAKLSAAFQDASISSMDSDVDLGELLGGMKEGLEEQNIAKVTEVKAMIEQGLSVFLASCNQLEGWVGLAGSRAQQYGQLADLLLGYITQYAQQQDSRSFALSLKFLATHHFSSVLEEMSNVLKYVDDEGISQMVLQMTEQVSFYLNSVEKLQLPQAGAEAEMHHFHEAWGDKPIKEIVEDALEKKCLKSAEAYLQLKPWVYGVITTNTIILTCLDIARQKSDPDSQLKVMMNIDENYKEVLKQLLHASDDQFEVWLIARALGDNLTSVERLSVEVISTMHRTLPDLITLPPQRWVELVKLGDASNTAISAPVTVGQVAGWTPLSMMLILCDLYAYSADADILINIDGDVMWQYLIHQNDVRNLKRWIFKEFQWHMDDTEVNETLQKEEVMWLDIEYKSLKSLQTRDSEKDFCINKRDINTSSESKFGVFNLLSEPQYASDVDSSVKSHESLDTSSIAPSEAENWSVQSFELYDRRECVWLQELFKPITQSMIDHVLHVRVPFTELVLNILAKCGVFTTLEKANTSLLMRRLHLSGALELLPQFTGDHPCQLSSSTVHGIILTFFGEFDLILPAYDYIRDFSLDSSDYKVLSKHTLASWPKVIVPFMSFQKIKDRQTLFDISCKNLEILSETCLDPKDLLVPAFLTMLYAPRNKLMNFINCNMDCEIHDIDKEIYSVCSVLSHHKLSPRQALERVSEQLPHLHMLCEGDMKQSLDVTVYDLLLGTVAFDITRLFTFQKNNRHGYDEKTEIPTWSNEDLVSRHGIQHSLDHCYYLREARPTYAVATLLANIHSSNTKKRLDVFRQSVCGIGLSSWPDRAVSSGSIAALLMAGIDTTLLRTVLSSAFLIYSVQTSLCNKFSLEKRKTHESFTKTEISRVLVQLCAVDTRTEAATVLLEMMENCVILSAIEGNHRPNEQITMALPLSNVIDMINPVFPGKVPEKHVYALFDGMSLCVKLSELYNLPQPVKLLQKLATSNQWLLFLVIIQVFNYPKLEVLKVVESFKSRALREHLSLALTHICYYREAHESRGRSKTTAHSKRSSLYAKIGIHSRESSTSPISSNDEDRPRSASPSECEMSVLDDAMSLTTTETVTYHGMDAWLTYECKDLYSVLLACHQRDSTANELVTASLALSSPVLAVFSACYDKHDQLLCLSVWLYTQLSEKSKLSLHDQLSTSDVHKAACSVKSDSNYTPPRRKNCCQPCDICVLESGLKELRWFILAHVADGSVDVIIEGFRIFDVYPPILNLTLAIKEVVVTGNQEKISHLLADSAVSLNHNSDLKQEILDTERDWVSSVVLSIIGTALDKLVTNSHLQYLFLSALTSVGQLPPFSSHGVNWNLVSQICKVLGDAKYKANFMEILSSFVAGNLKDTASMMVKGLSSKKCFSEALQICNLIDLPMFSILCGQLRAEFEKNKHLITSSYSLLKDYLNKGHSQLNEKCIPPEHAVELYVSVCEELPLFTMKCLCLQYALLWAYKCTDRSQLNVYYLDSFPDIFMDPPITSKSDQVLSRLEYSMWHACVQGSYAKESDFSLQFTEPPCGFERWPWEGNCTDSLDLNLVLQMAGIYDSSLLINPVEEEKPTSQDLKDNKSIRNYMQHATLHVDGLASGIIDQDLSYSLKGNTVVSDKENIKHDQNNASKGGKKETKYSPAGMLTEMKHPKWENKGDLLKHNIVQSLVNHCLDIGLLITACRILKFFKVKNKNVESLLLLLGMADGSKEEKVYERKSTSEASPPSPDGGSMKRERTTSRCTLYSSHSGFSLLSFEDDLHIKATSLIRATSGLTAGRRLGERVVILYKVAAALEYSYLYLIHYPNPITLVSLVLRLKQGSVMQLARDLISALPVPQSAVQNFLFEEAVATITAGPETGRGTMRDRLLGWEELEETWKNLVGLCQDPSALGHQLLEFGQRLGSSYPDQAERVHQISVELVIRAHDCFTFASNMEGIGTVLRTSLPLTTSLLNHSQWPLMVRLLVGVGRYSEMSYIIDALREHEQFEPLLGRETIDEKGSAKGLDRALVHYLRSKYPQDTDTLRLVALHFLLYSEVAEMWAYEGKTLVEQILESSVDLAVSCSTSSSLSLAKATSQYDGQTKQPPRKSPSVKSSESEGEFEPQFLENPDQRLLTHAMHSYAHAAQYYMQDQQFALAVEYSRHAELVALQIAQAKKSIPGPALRLLKLTPAGVRHVTTHYLRVGEAQLMGRAYNCSVDWGAALYHQYIKLGQEAYLTEYLATFRLSSQILLQVVNKLEHDGVTREGRKRVGNLLLHIEEGETVYRVGSQLGLRVNVDACLASSAAPYLRDTVFVQGCTANSALLE
ncbi:hypothetical protein Pmani_013942 [Petrolisthes manimaculis]|uniref:Spatacsin C-terminal domain-containing protein n=1 Tax=Petrolisthes manimaculis TaxID=1843537 RepID=A0AAE1PXF1_9EUCA|nr:hypothetical protein Pmani_013942 [Petrolisthes manimaculis]